MLVREVRAMQSRFVGHPNGPRRSMSVTKLKTVGHWQAAQWQHTAVADLRSNFRGRVITGMLTGGDAFPDALSVAEDQRAERAR